jgi:Rrf2 family transcriptional regulator, iron-sulfur cluster assembly transcription factor
MRIDTKGRVAVDAILDIAMHGNDDPVCLADIGKRQRVSVSYLEHLFKKLRRSGFVSSYRGPGGGYRLKRSLASISVADVIGAVDSDAFEDESAKGGGRWPASRGGVTDGLWRRVDDQLRDYLRSMTLDAVLAGAKMPSGNAEAPASSAAIETDRTRQPVAEPA